MKSPYTDSLAQTTWECKYHIINAEACLKHIQMKNYRVIDKIYIKLLT